MDSFYEHPRTAPIPRSTEKVPAIPVVPEVSMIFHNRLEGNSFDSVHLSYNAWKARNGNNIRNDLQQIPSNNSLNWANSQCLSKQVRFESPVKLVQHCNVPLQSNIASQNDIKRKADVNIPVKPNKLTLPFEHFYMANIPNRNLDLSIIDHPRLTLESKENLENIDPNENCGKLNAYINSNRKHSARDSRDLKITPHDNVTDNNQYLQKSDCFKTKDFDSDLTKTGQAIKTNLLEENDVIDLYNYKRDNMKACSTASRHHYNLDNTKLHVVKNSDQCQNNKQNYSEPSSCMYDSFDSHGGEGSKHQCGCCNNKKSLKNFKSNAAIQTEVGSVHSNSLENSNNVVHKNNDDPTVKDLLKVIHQQNDQLLILQKQVAALLSSREMPKQIETQSPSNRNVNIFGEQCRTSTQLESQGVYNPLQNCHVRKGPLPQFSLDVMTSFEVSIRRQQNLNRLHKDSVNHQPKICEVSESDSNAFNHSHSEAGFLNGICNKKNTDNIEVSLTLNDPVHVPETCPSPVNTVRIDMEDYSSDDEEVNPEEQWFYKNVKGQVNQILRKSGIWPSNNSSSPPDYSNDVPTHSIRKKVKEATIRHLNSIGVHVPMLEDTDDAIELEHPNMGFSQNDVSFAVKQLLMKYLPNEQLAKLAHMQAQKTTSPQLVDQAGPIKRRPEFSFATIQYMQKYNLLSDNNKPNNQPQTVPTTRQGDHFDRILDITAIRQQPKLL